MSVNTDLVFCMGVGQTSMILFTHRGALKCMWLSIPRSVLDNMCPDSHGVQHLKSLGVMCLPHVAHYTPAAVLRGQLSKTNS